MLPRWWARMSFQHPAGVSQDKARWVHTNWTVGYYHDTKFILNIAHYLLVFWHYNHCTVLFSPSPTDWPNFRPSTPKRDELTLGLEGVKDLLDKKNSTNVNKQLLHQSKILNERIETSLADNWHPAHAPPPPQRINNIKLSSPTPKKSLQQTHLFLHNPAHSSNRSHFSIRVFWTRTKLPVFHPPTIFMKKIPTSTNQPTTTNQDNQGTVTWFTVLRPLLFASSAAMAPAWIAWSWTSLPEALAATAAMAPASLAFS